MASRRTLLWRAGAVFWFGVNIEEGGQEGVGGAWSPPHLPDVTEGQTGANYARYDYFVRRPSWTTRGVYPPGARWTAHAAAEDSARLFRSTNEEGGTGVPAALAIA